MPFYIVNVETEEIDFEIFTNWPAIYIMSLEKYSLRLINVTNCLNLVLPSYFNAPMPFAYNIHAQIALFGELPKS